ncbi:MAG: hypothetical protein Q9164_002213 [Protoblastenia rupestris]
MEEIARRHEAPPSFEQRFLTTSSTIEGDLQNRIRSLLNSRNQRRPPKTPYSSPDYKYRSSQDHIGNAIAPPRKRPLDPVKASAALARLQSFQADMVATGFDGPATLLPDNVDGPRRYPSQPAMVDVRAQSLDGGWLPLIPGLDQKASANTLGREETTSAQLRQVNALLAKSTPSRIPRYNMRVATPKASSESCTQTRPNALHVPGSYRTEANVASTGSPKLTETAQLKPCIERSEDYFGSTVEPSLNATVAFDKGKNDSIQHPLLQSEGAVEDTSVTLKTSGKRSPRTLLISRLGPSGVSKTAEPVLTIGADDGHSHGEAEPANLQGPETGLHPPKAPSRSSSLRTLHLDADEQQSSAIPPLLAETSGPPVEPPLEDAPKLSPVTKALSMLSEISGRSRLGSVNSVSTTTRQKRGSVAKPSEIQPSGSSRSTTPIAQSENQENEHTQTWIEQFVGKRSASSKPGYNLTARTNYRQNHAATDVKRLRSGNLPPKGDIETESTDEASFRRRHQANNESFSKVILDLESLLKEALNMAGKVASRENSEAVPMLAKTEARKDYDHGRLQSTEAKNGSDDSDSSSGQDEEDHRSREPRGRVVLVESDSATSRRGHFKKARDATPYPSATRHQSVAAPPNEETSSIESDMRSTSQLAVPKAATMISEQPAKPVDQLQPFIANDWAFVGKPSQARPLPPQEPPSLQVPMKEQHNVLVRGLSDQQRPPTIQPRVSSVRLHGRRAPKINSRDDHDYIVSSGGSDSDGLPYVADFKNDGLHYHPVVREAMAGDDTKRTVRPGLNRGLPREDTLSSLRDKEIEIGHTPRQAPSTPKTDYSLKSKHHFSIREPHGFSLSRSHRRAPIARDWSKGRKRFVATVTCINTALMGLIIGIYAGEVPAIQYALADEHHYTILGNVVLFLGLAFTTSLLWPLPLLHGRKPYTLAALVILLPLQFPQALAVNDSRSPYVASYRVGVLLPRAFSGVVMGFANINFKTTLLDLFGASLQSGNPHEEMVNENDVRRHGGGIGAWLGIWTWCSIMSIGIGFLIGAGIISGLNVSWGFWITIILNAAVLLLNVMVPEVRRSPYRRSMAEVRTGTDVSRRIARGEIKMHLESTGPKHWYEEVIAGHVLSVRMLKQPGFLVLALYQGWIYGQVVIVIVLLGALLSKYYYFRPQYVGLGVAAIPIAALLAVPFQKASYLSRARHHKQRTDSMTFEKRVTWTSHLVRRSIFMIVLPFAGLAYTLSSSGPPVHYMVPIIFAGIIGFLSNLAIAECNGIIMETFDTSDLQPGMTGRPRRVLPEAIRMKRTNFSCFPRVTAGFAITQTFAFLIAAGATGCGGVVERRLGAQTATAVVAGVLLVLTLLLIGVLWRFKTVQIIPSERFGTNVLSGPEDEWKPVIIGNPSGTTRRMSLLELGTLSRWSEIRRRNRVG